MIFGRMFLLGFLWWQMAGCGFEAVPTSTYDLKKETSSGVIYGENSIEEAFSVSTNSNASVALIKTKTFEDLKSGKGTYTVEERYGVLKGLAWTQQPAAAFCSGVVVGKNLVLTAGHCVPEDSSCQDLSIVFGFEGESGKTQDPTAVRCKKIVARNNDLLSSGLDYALLLLERDVLMPSVKVGKETLASDESIYSFGYPLGAYKKKARGKIREILRETNVYISNLDVFEGNSGSPVFSMKTHQLVGILSSGESDFEGSTQDSAEMSVKHCENTKCSGEIIIPIQKILADIVK